MSQNPGSIELEIVPRAHDVGGFQVHRALPAQQKQMIGPFIFFDQMGPGEFLTGKGLDVRLVPHVRNARLVERGAYRVSHSRQTPFAANSNDKIQTSLPSVDDLPTPEGCT
jgi:hypothetical protein